MARRRRKFERRAGNLPFLLQFRHKNGLRGPSAYAAALSPSLRRPDGQAKVMGKAEGRCLPRFHKIDSTERYPAGFPSAAALSPSLRRPNGHAKVMA